MRVLVCCGILALLVFRILAIFVIPPLDDEAVELRMADDIGRFVNFPVYFYQQAYMGPLECYLLAPFLRLFGSSLPAGRTLNSIFFLSFMAMFLWVVRRLFDRTLTATLFILLCVLPFPILFFTTTIGWAESLTLDMVSLILLLKVVEAPVKARSTSWMLGFVSGLAFWCNPIFVVWLVPIGIGLAIQIPSSWKRGLPVYFLVGFIVGLFPIWIHGLQTGTLISMAGTSLSSSQFAGPEDMPKIFYLFFARMKYFLTSFSYGMESPVAGFSIRWASWVPFSLFVISFASLALFFARRRDALSPKERLFYVFVLVPPVVLVCLYSARNFLNDEAMRFFLPLVIPFTFSMAWWLREHCSPILRKWILCLLLGVEIAGTLFSAKGELKKKSELEQLVRHLEEKGLTTGIAEFGLAYSLNILSHNRLLVSPPWYNAADRTVLEKVRKGEPHFFILDHSTGRFRKRLEADPHLRKTSWRRYDIFYGDSGLLKQFVTMGELKEE